jgi:hypothetical protein
MSQSTLLKVNSSQDVFQQHSTFKEAAQSGWVPKREISLGCRVPQGETTVSVTTTFAFMQRSGDDIQFITVHDTMSEDQIEDTLRKYADSDYEIHSQIKTTALLTEKSEKLVTTTHIWFTRERQYESQQERPPYYSLRSSSR